MNLETRGHKYENLLSNKLKRNIAFLTQIMFNAHLSMFNFSCLAVSENYLKGKINKTRNEL